MKALAVCLAMLMTTLLVPPSAAEDVAHFGGNAIGLDYSWSIEGASGSCYGDRIHMALARVNSRLAVTAQSGTRTLGNGVPWQIPQSNCPLVITALPGLWVNPCQLLKGEAPVPAVNVGDPYFHSPLGNAYWTKTVTFADGGYAAYTVHVAWQPGREGSFTGSCRSGTATASWSAYYTQIDIGTEPV